MYLRVSTKLKFPDLAQLLNPDLTEDSLGWDYENVYEWMWVDLPQFDFVLNVSREHGGADVDDELYDQLAGDPDAQRRLMTPGPTYINAWTKVNGERVNDLPESLAQFLAKQLNVDVDVFGNRCTSDLNSRRVITIRCTRSRGPRGFWKQ